MGATLVFYASQSRFNSDTPVSGVILAACAMNVGLVILGALRGSGPRRAARVLSPIFGIVTWTALVRLTDGIASSPFLPSFWLEVLLGALVFSSGGIALTTLGAVAGLWLAEPRVRVEWVELVLHSVFMLAMGTGVLLTHRRWRQAQARLSLEIAAQARHLNELQVALDDTRAAAATGAHTARLAHRLKNAVHSLRGFARLVESDFQAHAPARSIDGLRGAIDQLDHLAMETLEPMSQAEPAELLPAERLRTIIEGAVDEVAVSYPVLHVDRRFGRELHAVRFSSAALRDIVHNLLLNSAEATNGHGRIRIETSVTPEGWLLRVSDDGPGIAQQVAGRLFRPGATSKPQGSGVGLFVSERQASAGGGRLWASRLYPRGTSFHVLLPTAEAEC